MRNVFLLLCVSAVFFGAIGGVCVDAENEALDGTQ